MHGRAVTKATPMPTPPNCEEPAMNRFLKPALVLTAFALAACSTTPYLDDHIGDATRAAVQMQVANPDAPTATGVKMDAQNAAEAVNRYNKAGREPPQNSNVFSIGVGTN